MEKLGNNNYDLVNNLENRLDSIKYKWKTTNDQRKTNYIAKESAKGGLFTILGAIMGGLVGGPPGAMIGAAVAGGSSASYSTYKSYGKNS